MGRGNHIDSGCENWLQQQNLFVVDSHPISGGCIAKSQRLFLNNKQSVFIKEMVQPITGMFHSEAEGLKALSDSAVIATPQVLFQNEFCLVMSFISSGSASSDFDEQLGRQLAELHAQTVDKFGYRMDTFCGATRQPNPRLKDGIRFYQQHRFDYLARKCLKQGVLSKQDMHGIESICLRLEQLVPFQNPALLHGDLWRGNVHVGPMGEPVLIDPAVYWGWPEADLAMTKLFGGFSSRFYHAYEEVRPLERGWEGRVDLYNLWHLLNHLLLFGESYLPDLRQVIHKYA